MSIGFKQFEAGLRIKPHSSFTSDPITGKVGQIYWNVTRSVLRICISATPEWQDLFIHNHTIDDATLRWDSTADRWIQNDDLRINSSSIYTPDGTTALGLNLTTGDTSTVSVDGADITLTPGSGGAGANQGRLILDLAEITALPVAGGKALSFSTPDNTTAGQFGSDFTFSTGSGPLGLGSSTWNAENETHNVTQSFNLSSTSAFIEGTTRINLSSQRIGIKAQSLTDPLTAEEGDIYYNLEFKRLKKYIGSRWEFWDVNDKHQNINLITYKDDISTIYPATDATLIEGQTIVDGDYVIFTNLTVAPNKMYKANVDGSGNIIWTDLVFSTDATGNPTKGQVAFITSGNTNTDYLFIWDGTQWLNHGLFRGETDDILRWGGTQWEPNEFIHSDGQKFYLKDNAIADTVKAEDFTLRASNKTAGTGDGGDLIVRPGTSLGGIQGRTILEGDRVKFAAQSAGNPAAEEESDVYYDTVDKNLKLRNDGAWNRLESSRVINENQITTVTGGGTITWDSTSSSLAWASEISVNIAGVDITKNKIAASNLLLSSDGDAAYAIIDRTGATTIITATVQSMSTIATQNNVSENKVMLAFRDKGEIYWGSGNDIKSTVNGGIFTKKTITNNTSGIVFAVDASENDAIIVKYSIKRGTNIEVGQFFITNDGTNAGISNQSNALSPTGIVFDANINTTDIELTYMADNSGLGAEIRYSLSKWTA